MKTITKNIVIGATSLAATLAICFGILAWSEPSANPPDGNIAAPVNTGAVLQNKIGDLLIGAGLKISSLGTAFALKTNDAQETPRLVVGQDGNVGIGTTGPAKTLEVAGDAKSTRFCLGGKCCATWEECAGGSVNNGIWVKRTNFQSWSSYVKQIVSSADGSKLAAVGQYGNLLLSTDSGATWTTTLLNFPAVLIDNAAITLSSDGNKIAVAAWDDFDRTIYIITSIDFGAHWEIFPVLASKDQLSHSGGTIVSIASSADGSKLSCSDGQFIYTSINSGVTWRKRQSLPEQIRTLVSSANGNGLIAMGYEAAYLSTDAGATWSNLGLRYFCPGDNTAVSSHVDSIAASPDFTKLFAVISCSELVAGAYVPSNPQFSISLDSGATWTAKTIPYKLTDWTVASSADGGKLFIASRHFPIVFASNDSGALWLGQGYIFGGDTLGVLDVSSSSDGNRLVGISNKSSFGGGDGGDIFTDH